MCTKRQLIRRFWSKSLWIFYRRRNDGVCYDGRFVTFSPYWVCRVMRKRGRKRVCVGLEVERLTNSMKDVYFHFLLLVASFYS